MTHELSVGSHVWPAAHVGVPGSHRSALSSQLSAPLQLTPSSHTPTVPAQTAAALQVSLPVQNAPSLQLAPVFGLHTVGALVRQIWHPLLGFGLSGPKQTPPMTQPLQAVTHMPGGVAGSQTWPAPHVAAPGWQRSVVSLQVSVPLHVTASTQKFVAVPEQRPAEQTSPRVQKSPSSQLAPSLSLQLVGERGGVQTKQGLPGCRVPLA